MTCKYCGRECTHNGYGLSFGGNNTCQSSPSKKHILLQDGEHCVFCGGETEARSNGLYVGGNSTCQASPTNKHQLYD